MGNDNASMREQVMLYALEVTVKGFYFGCATAIFGCFMVIRAFTPPNEPRRRSF